jgi:hypothetical protein
MIERHVKIGWECLSRVETIDNEVAERMKKARNRKVQVSFLQEYLCGKGATGFV